MSRTSSDPLDRYGSRGEVTEGTEGGFNHAAGVASHGLVLLEAALTLIPRMGENLTTDEHR